MKQPKVGGKWWTRAWNPFVGCTAVSKGCANCWARRMARRQRRHCEKCYQFVPHVHDERILQPLDWKKPQRIAVNLMGDLFHRQIRYSSIADVLETMQHADWHTYFLLTKRVRRMAEVAEEFRGWPLPNVWIGTSVEDQDTANQRIHGLLSIAAAKHFISYEPALGPADLTRITFMESGAHWEHNVLTGEAVCLNSDSMDRLVGGAPTLDWVICGGESGPGARPMHPNWARSIRDQCQEAGVAYWFKQMAKREPIPEDLMIREQPK